MVNLQGHTSNADVIITIIKRPVVLSDDDILHLYIDVIALLNELASSDQTTNFHSRLCEQVTLHARIQRGVGGGQAVWSPPPPP